MPPAAVDVRCTESVVVVSLDGHLDLDAGTRLVDVARTAAVGDVTRLEIDLRAVTSFDVDGAATLVACRDIGAGLAEGLHYRTGQGPGRNALLAAYAVA